MFLRAGENPAPPLLEAEPGPGGTLTFWLATPPQSGEIDNNKLPRTAREGMPIVEGADEKWSFPVSDKQYADFGHSEIMSGYAWARCYVSTQNGGKRRITIATLAATRVFRDRELVLDVPEPKTRRPEIQQVEIELPKGVCELSVAVAVRYSALSFYLSLCDAALPKTTSRPAAGDKILIPVAEKDPNKGALAVKGLAFVSKDYLVNSGDTISLAAYNAGSVICGVGPITAKILGFDGKPLAAELPAKALNDLWQPWEVKYKVPDVQDKQVKHELSLELYSGERLLGTKKITLAITNAIVPATDALKSEIKERADKVHRVFLNASLAIEKAQSISNRVPLTPAESARALDQLDKAKAYADAEEAGKDPFEGRNGYFERAYQSRIDEGIQPYSVLVPSAYGKLSSADKEKKEKKFPLVVVLHGYSLKYSTKDRFWDEYPEFNALFDQHNSFMVVPFARSNTDFQSCGEVDVLDVIAEVKRLYPIDDDRVYFYGYSMGGMGAYTIAAHYPDMFAAALIIAGRADSPLQNQKPLEQFHPFKQWLIHADNPISLCENLINIPMRIYHSQDDRIIKADEARRMEKRLKELGCDAKLTVSMGEHEDFANEVLISSEPLKWLLDQKRKTHPSKCHMKSYSLRYAAQDGVKVTSMPGPLQPIDIEWTRGPDGQPRFSSALPAEPADLQAPRKTAKLCGPVREAICGPFMVVYGTSGSAAANAANKKNAEAFAKYWVEFTRSAAIMKADTEISDLDKKTHNLFLFGEEQENLLHAAAAKDLPISIKNGQATLGEKTVPLAGKGLMYIYPSPFAKDKEEPHSVVICTGMLYGRGLDVNHKLDLVPDFLLYNERSEADSTGTNHAICAGFFNDQWKIDAKMLWWLAE